MYLQLYFCVLIVNIISCKDTKIYSDLVTNSSEYNNKNNITTLNENLDFIIERENSIDQFQTNEKEHKPVSSDRQNYINVEDNEINNDPNLHQENVIKKIHNKHDDYLSFRDYLINLMNIEENDPAKDTSILHNVTEAEELNTTVGNSTASNNTTSKKCFCIDIDDRGKVEDVEIINSTVLQSLLIHDANISSRSVPSKCFLIYFYSPYCPFSTQGSAYVNALARSLKNIPIYGLDSIMFHSVNARYGVMGTPSLILFHNGNVVARYNASEYSTFNLEAFIQHFSNQVAESINVTSHDFKALLPSKVIASSPFALYIAWVFLITCAGWLFFNSEFYAKLKEAVLNNWREAEAQHAHDD